MRVDFFESPAEPCAASVWKLTSEVRRVQLQAQTRVYFQDGRGRWRAGRVLVANDSCYFVRVPNVVEAVEIDERCLYVRWDKAPRDPLQVLLSGANETPRYRDAREPVRRLLLAERAATASATGIMSAGVRIYAHQISAALRIIRDPVQRYLLADEVGMGKTIEAGLVMRQLLVDEPGRRIGVIVPDALIAQWRTELRDKLYLDDFPTGSGEAPYRIVGHNHVAEWRGLEGIDLLVVDEAHLLARTQNPSESPYRELAELAHAVPRVLMLTATPFARDTQTHLALLHLLDPELFRWEDRQRFESLLAARRELAFAVFGLDPDPDPENPELLSLQFDQIRALIPDDEMLNEATERAMAVFGPRGSDPEAVDQEELRRAVEAVRAHIAETYRLHHRVIRNRRYEVARQKLDDDGLLAPFEFTGRTRPKDVRLKESVEASAGAQAVFDWVTNCAGEILDGGLDVHLYGPVLGSLISRVGGPVHDLVSVLEYRVNGIADMKALSPNEVGLLDQAPTLAFESGVLTMLQSVEGTDALPELSAVVAKISAPARAVIFCGRGRLGADLLHELRGSFGAGGSFYGHLEDQSEAERESAIGAWAASGGVLVVDDTGDVGRNLQVASLALHIRLPWNPNALEQRIGRVDRYGSHRAAQQYIVAGGELGELSEAWRTVLEDGFKIFDESISAYQEAVERLALEVWDATLTDGIEGLLGKIGSIREDLQEEHRRINEMDALESSFGTRVDGEKMALAIARFEEKPLDLERAYLDLVTGAEGFRLGSSRNKDGSINFERDPHNSPLVSPRLLRRIMSVDAARTGYFDRWQLTPGRRLFRRGNPFVDGVESLLDLDDRGQAVAMWRLYRKWPNDPFVFFGFDFLVEADRGPILDLLGNDCRLEPVARRRADAALPPQYQRVWVSAHDEQPVSSPRFADFLSRAFNPEFDRRISFIDKNLNYDRIPALHAILGGQENLKPVARSCFEAGLRHVNVAANVVGASARAVGEVRSQTEVILAQSRARSRAIGLVTDPTALDMEVAMGQAIEAGVRHPVVRLTGVSCVVVSAQPWESYV